MNLITKEQKLLDMIDRIDCQLSPENLHCDGEITRAQAQAKAKRLWRDRAECESALGHKVEYKG